MADTNYGVNDLIRDELYKNMDEEYGRQQAKLIPECGNIIGVRMPVLNKMAREIASVNWKEYLQGARSDTYEEILLQALVLGYARGKVDDILLYIEEFIPLIDNWAVCDHLCAGLGMAREYQEEFWEFITKWVSRDGRLKKPGHPEYIMRFVTVMMLDYFINDRYIDNVLFAYNTMKHPGYYFKMGVAWGLETAYYSYPDKVLAFLKDNDLDDETLSMKFKKLLNSGKLSDEEKQAIKEIRE